MKVRVFSLTKYLEEALKRAEYFRDDNGVVIAQVSGVQGFYAQGDNHEEARDNLKDVIEGNVLLALQLGWEIPAIPGAAIEEKDVQAHPS